MAPGASLWNSSNMPSAQSAPPFTQCLSKSDFSAIITAFLFEGLLEEDTCAEPGRWPFAFICVRKLIEPTESFIYHGSTSSHPADTIKRTSNNASPSPHQPCFPSTTPGRTNTYLLDLRPVCAESLRYQSALRYFLKTFIK